MTDKIRQSFEVKSFDSFERSFDEDFSSNATWQAEAQAFVEGSTLRALFSDHGWVYTLVDHYARFISLAYPRMKQRIVEDDEERYEPLDDHPIASLLKAPNNYMRWSSFIYSIAVDYLLMGNVILFKDSKGQLFRLPPEKMQVKYNETTGELQAYVAAEDLKEHGVPTQVTFMPREILHIKRPNPNTLYWGLSPFVPGRRSVLFDRYSKDYTLKFYNRGAAPDAVLETENELTKAQQELLIRSFEQKYTGRQNQRRTILLPQGIKFNPIMVDMVSQRFLELVESNRDEIINLTHTPKHALSLQETGSLGSEEHRLALEYYYSTTLLPDMETFASELGHWLIPADEKETTELWFETQHIEALFENMNRKAELVQKLGTVATVNEIRTKVLDWEELEDGGDVLVSLNQPQQPAFGSFNLSLPETQQAKQEEKATTTNTPARYEHIDFTPPEGVAEQAKRGLELRREYRRGGTEVGIKRASQLANREVISSETARRMYRFFIRHESNRNSELPNGDPGNGKIAWLLWGGDPGFRWAKKLWEQMESADESKGERLDRAQWLAAQEDDSALFMKFDKNQRTLTKLQTKFGDRLKQAQKSLEETEERKISTYRKQVQETLLEMLSLSMPIIERTAKEKTKDLDDDMRRLERRLNDAYTRLGRKYRQNFEREHAETVDLGYNANMDLIFNEPAKEAIEALKARDSNNRLAILEERGIRSFSGIAETTTKQIVNKVRKGLEAQKTVAEIARDIRDTAPRSIANRADTIARTETLTAYSIGQQAQLENTVEVVPEAKKGWLSANDERVRGNPSGLYPDARDNHWELSGEVVDIDDDFSNGLAVPRDTKGEAHQVINCFVGDTLFEGKNIKKAFARLYKGDLITVTTSDGSNITGSPNHPILTDRGWIPLGEIDKGYNLVKAVLSDVPVNCDDMKIMPTKASEFFDSLSKSFTFVRVDCASGNFHGDLSASDIDIVDIDSQLKCIFQAIQRKMSTDKFFTIANLTVSDLLSSCTEDESVLISRATSSFGMTGSDLILPLFETHLAPFKFLGLTGSSQLNSSISENSIKNLARVSELLGKTFDANAFVDVQFYDVIDKTIMKLDKPTHVYNLQTDDETYIANGFIVHNCRCTSVPLLPEDIEDFEDEITN